MNWPDTLKANILLASGGRFLQDAHALGKASQPTRMKTLLTIVIFVFGLASSYGGQRPANSLSLEAHEVGTVSSFGNLWQTDWGSYERNNYQTKKLLITVHDLSRKVPRVEVQIFFIAADQKTGRWSIYKRAAIPVEMKGLLEAKGYVVAPSIKSNEQHYAALREDYASGLKMVGWIVQGKIGKEIFQTRASSQTLLEVAENNPRQQFSLSALIADSRPATSAE